MDDFRWTCSRWPVLAKLNACRASKQTNVHRYEQTYSRTSTFMTAYLFWCDNRDQPRQLIKILINLSISRPYASRRIVIAYGNLVNASRVATHAPPTSLPYADAAVCWRRVNFTNYATVLICGVCLSLEVNKIMFRNKMNANKTAKRRCRLPCFIHHIGSLHISELLFAWQNFTTADEHFAKEHWYLY